MSPRPGMGRQPNERSEVRLVDQSSASWNQIAPWLERLEAIRLAA